MIPINLETLKDLINPDKNIHVEGTPCNIDELNKYTNPEKEVESSSSRFIPLIPNL